MDNNLHSQKLASYTTKRLDVISCVPNSALKILDVGCSNGELGKNLRMQLPERYIAGIEFDQSLCNEARNHLDFVIQADLNQLMWKKHFEQESFDCLIFADVLEHLIDPWLVLSNATVLLKKTGLVIISLPNIRHISALSTIYAKGTFPQNPRGIFDHTHLRWFTLSDAKKLCNQANLSIKAIVPRLRLKDQPGGKLNSFVEKYLSSLGHWHPIREFLSYQFVLVTLKN